MRSFSSGARSRLSQAVRDSLRVKTTTERRPTARRKVLLEALEPRLLLDGDPFTFTAGVLAVTGSANSDVISIEQKAASADGGFIIDLSINGALSTVGDADVGVKSIAVALGAGDDSLRLVTDLNMDVSVIGGDGDDTLFGANKDTDWILTGAGIGTVADVAYDGFERLVGGSGDDIFKIDPGGSVSLGVQGGGGDDALVADNVANVWQVNGAGSGLLNTLAFQGIENLVGGTSDDLFKFAAGGSVTGAVEGGTDSADAETAAVDTLDFSALAGPITVNLAAGTAPALGTFSDIDLFVGSASANDMLIGPVAPSVVWSITKANEGTVADVAFKGFENLTGAPNNSDLFIFEKNDDGTGSLSGIVNAGLNAVVDGVRKGSDGLIIRNSDTEGLVVNPPGWDSSSGPGGVTLFGRTVLYTGLDAQDFFDGDPQNPVVAGSVGADRIRVYAGADGSLNIGFQGLGFYRVFDGLTTSAVTIDAVQVAGLKSLRIDGREGGDTITVESLPGNFTGALNIYGSRLPIVGTLAPVPDEDPFNDTVIFSGNITTSGLDIWADTIRVNDNVLIDVVDEGDIVFRARLVGIPDLENLSPAFGINRSVEISIGKKAVLNAGSIYLIAEADDKSIADLAGVPKEFDKFVIEPLMDQLGTLLAFPVKVLVKSATATVKLGTDSQLNGALGTVGIYATAGANSSGKASGSLFAVGYAQATAVASIDIAAGSKITPKTQSSSRPPARPTRRSAPARAAS
jgi:hypothetical protein